MEQAKMLRNGVLWDHMHQIVSRYNLLREQFQTFAAEAATLAGEPAKDQGLADNIRAALHLDDNYFDVTFVGRVFRFRFAPRIAETDPLPDGHIVVTEYNPLTKKEGEPLDDIPFDGHAKTGLNDPADFPKAADPIRINTRIAARYLVLHAIYNAL